LSNDLLDHLKSLHTSAIDARNGYQEALEDAEGKGMTPLSREIVALHDRNAGELARQLPKANEIAVEKGSFMTLVHQTIVDVRSLFNGLDESILPGLIDGEKRNISNYEDVLKDTKTPANLTGFLTGQRDRIVEKVAQMEMQKAASEHVP